jgi:hypothetical protein
MTVHTKTFKLHLGKGVDLDVMTLLDTKMLLVANSGGGKSYLIRVVCEQVIDRIPTIILDREGEFATLREKHDVVLIGEGGEADTSVSTCAKLVRALVELGVSAVINLYDLSKQDQRKFVRIFCESLLKLPRSLWRPMFVVIDEIHEWCPESGGREAESREAVIEACSKLRKRGACVIGATQRFAKFSKDAAAEFNNVCVGRIAQDVDLRRAIDILGLQHREGVKTLREFEPGEWFGFGPAFEQRGIIRFRCAAAKTTHPKAGERHRLLAPAPSKAILKVAPELAVLKQQVEDEKNELDSLRTEVKRLRSLKPTDPATVVAQVAKRVDTAPYVLQGREDVLSFINPAVAALAEHVNEVGLACARLGSAFKDLQRNTSKAMHLPKPKQLANRANGKDHAVTTRTAPPKDRPKTTTSTDNNVGSGGMHRMLVALAQHPDGLERNTLGLLAQISAKGGTFATYLGRLRAAGYVRDEGRRIIATDEGVVALGDFDPLPTGRDLAEYWLKWAGNGGQRRVLEVLLEAGEEGLTRNEVAEQANLASNAGTFATYLGRLRTANLIAGRERLRVVDTLLGG